MYCEETHDWAEEAQFKWNIQASYLADDYAEDFDTLSAQWPRTRSPDSLIDAMQTGDRLR